MRIIDVGLTGGIGAGKSMIGGLLSHLGASVIDADKVGHQLLTSVPELAAAVRQQFGPSVLDPAGGIDRKRLGHLVFTTPSLLPALNALMHPFIVRAIHREVTVRRERWPAQLMVVEAPLLFEAGIESFCQRIVAVAAPRPTVLARLLTRPGMTEVRARQIMESQWDPEEKVRRADDVVDNGGDVLSAARQTFRVFLTAAVQLGKAGPCCTPLAAALTMGAQPFLRNGHP